MYMVRRQFMHTYMVLKDHVYTIHEACAISHVTMCSRYRCKSCHGSKAQPVPQEVDTGTMAVKCNYHAGGEMKNNINYFNLETMKQ